MPVAKFNLSKPLMLLLVMEVFLDAGAGFSSSAFTGANVEPKMNLPSSNFPVVRQVEEFLKDAVMV